MEKVYNDKLKELYINKFKLNDIKWKDGVFIFLSRG